MFDILPKDSRLATRFPWWIGSLSPCAIIGRQEGQGQEDMLVRRARMDEIGALQGLR